MTTKKSVYQIVTDRILEDLQKGQIPWRKPWTGVRDGAYSRSTGKPYSLLNQMLLGKPGEYATFKQIQEAGGKVRKGEKASMVVFWKMNKYQDRNESGEVVEKTIPMLRYFNVFHIESQTEGIEVKHNPADLKPLDPIAAADLVINGYAEREHLDLRVQKDNRAYYAPAADMVVVPLLEQFSSPAEFYSTAFHELTHSTGHKNRLGRFQEGAKNAAFGSEDYSKEELVAEIGAAASLTRLGINTPASDKNTVAYIQSWIKVLKDDPRMIVSAASKAEKAVDLIFGDTNYNPEPEPDKGPAGRIRQ